MAAKRLVLHQGTQKGAKTPAKTDATNIDDIVQYVNAHRTENESLVSEAPAPGTFILDSTISLQDAVARVPRPTKKKKR